MSISLLHIYCSSLFQYSFLHNYYLSLWRGFLYVTFQFKAPISPLSVTVLFTRVSFHLSLSEPRNTRVQPHRLRLSVFTPPIKVCNWPGYLPGLPPARAPFATRPRNSFPAKVLTGESGFPTRQIFFSSIPGHVINPSHVILFDFRDVSASI